MNSPSRSATWLALATLVTFLTFTQARADSQAPADGPRSATEGFYPIWENTGNVEAHTQGYVGTNGAHFGILNQAQVGVLPVHFIYRTPNINIKFKLPQVQQTRTALQVGTLYLMSQASHAFFSSMYTSRLDNPDFAVTLLPVSLTTTTDFGDWLELHQTATYLHIHSSGDELESTGYVGYSAVAEFKARQKHSLLLHATEVGFWNHDFGMVGTSYRYHSSAMEVRLGYYYRFRPDGAQAGPLLGIGFNL